MERNMYGYIPSPKDLRDYRVATTVAPVELPEEFSLNSNYTIKDQGSVGSCVAHSTSSMLEKYGEVFSKGWIYGYRPTGYYQGVGMYPREALKTLQQLGAVKNKDFDINVEIPNAKSMVDMRLDELTEKAEDSHQGIASYVRLYTNDEIKQWLMKGVAVPIAIQTEHITLVNNVIQLPTKQTSSGHALLIVGWNKTGFVIQNSWGKSWGNNGYAILPYEYTVQEAWGISLEEDDINVTKPSAYIARTLIQIIIEFFKSLFNK